MVAKGKAFINTDKLAELFNLPKGVEIMAVRPREALDGFEFLLVSSEETSITKVGVESAMMRRTSVPIKHEESKVVTKGQIQLENYTTPLTPFEQVPVAYDIKKSVEEGRAITINITSSKTDASSIVEEIKKNLGKIGK